MSLKIASRPPRRGAHASRKVVTGVALVIFLAPMWGGVRAEVLSSSSAEISRLELTLLDLNPNDGVAPSLTFLPDHNSWAGAGAGSDSQFAAGNGVFGSAEVSAADGDLAGSAVVSGDPFAGGTELLATAAAGHGAGYSDTGAALGGNREFLFPSFMLSANTQVTFSGTASVAARGDASSTLYADLGPYTGEFDHRGGIRLIAETGGDAFQQDFAISWANVSTSSAPGALNGTVNAWAYAIPAVPEPGSPELLCAGLGALALSVGLRLMQRKASGRRRWFNRPHFNLPELS